MTAVLNTKHIYVPQMAPPPPPTLTIQIPKPESYEFRVLETMDYSGKIVSVKLQVQVFEHDELGTGTLKFDWKDVPRVVVTKDGMVISK